MLAALAKPHCIKQSHRRRRRIASGSLDYNYFRDYEPGTGRYVESDPVGLDGDIDTYAYTFANPLRFTDRLGLWVKRCARKLGNRDKPATSLHDPLRHEYLNVSGQIFSFQEGSNP